jgi:sec-independent protein translocase protein TatA
MGFGNLGISEIAIIAVLILLFFGPERIPEMARTVGQIMREFRRGVNEIQRELQEVERSVSEDSASDGESRRPPRGRIEPGGSEGAGDGSGGMEEVPAAKWDHRDMRPDYPGEEEADDEPDLRTPPAPETGEEPREEDEDDAGDRHGGRSEGGPHPGSSPD